MINSMSERRTLLLKIRLGLFLENLVGIHITSVKNVKFFNGVIGLNVNISKEEQGFTFGVELNIFEFYP